MREHELYDRLELARMRLNLKPISCVLNCLNLSYLLLLERYAEMQDLANTYSITASVPCVLCENFRTVASIQNKDLESAENQIRYALSLDPEDYISLLFQGLVEMAKGLTGQDYFRKALVHATVFEKEKLIPLIGEEEDIQYREITRLPEYLTTEQIEKLRGMVSSEPNNPILKVSLAEAYFKRRDFRGAEWLLQSVTAIYSYYPRSLYLISKINEEYKNDIDTAFFYLRKVYAVNPLTKYAIKKEVYLDERELSDLEELVLLFKVENPIIKFFARKYAELVQKTEARNEELARMQEHKAQIEPPPQKAEPPVEKEPQPPKEMPLSPALQEAFHLLKQKKYKEALPLFIKLLKEKAEQPQ